MIGKIIESGKIWIMVDITNRKTKIENGRLLGVEKCKR